PRPGLGLGGRTVNLTLESMRRGLGGRRGLRGIRMLGLALLLAASTSACRQDMHDGAKYEPLEESPFFKDHRASRPLIPGTIARGHLHEDKLLYTGKNGDQISDVFPF